MTQSPRGAEKEKHASGADIVCPKSFLPIKSQGVQGNIFRDGGQPSPPKKMSFGIQSLSLRIQSESAQCDGHSNMA